MAKHNTESFGYINEEGVPLMHICLEITGFDKL